MEMYFFEVLKEKSIELLQANNILKLLIWSKKLTNDEPAIIFFNRNEKENTFKINCKQLGISHNRQILISGKVPKRGIQTQLQH